MSNAQTRVSNQTKSRVSSGISGVVLAILVLVGSFGGYQAAWANTGEGTATINGTTNVTTAISTSSLISVVLTVGAAGINSGASNPTFTIPTGFTAPTIKKISAAAVDSDGEWFVEGAGVGGCLTSTIPSSATGQVITADVTTTCAEGDTITLYYWGSSPATAMAPTNFDIRTDDAVGGGGVASITTSPAHTVTVEGTAVVTNHAVGGVATTNNLTGLAQIGGSDKVIGGFKIEAAGEDMTVVTIRTSVTLGSMDIGELTNLRIVDDDDFNGLMHANELAVALDTIEFPTVGTNDFTVSTYIGSGLSTNFFIVGTIASSVSYGDTLDIDVTGAGSVSNGVTSGSVVTLTGTSANDTRIITDTTAPTLVSAKFTDVNQLTLVFSEPVDAVAGDFTNLELPDTSALTVASISGTTTNTIVITTNQSTITGAMTGGQIDIAGTVNDVSAANNAFAGVANQAVTDGFAATISSITSVTGNGSYNVPDAINVTVTFSEAVTLAGGTLDVTLDTGDVISIVAFGPATTATGTYTVGAGDTSADLDSTAIVLNGGTLVDADVTATTVALPATTIADGSAIVIDTTVPTVNITAPLTTTRQNAAAIIAFTNDSDDTSTVALCSIDGFATSVACTTGVTTLTALTGFGALAEDATFTLSVRDTDLAGNTGNDSEALIVKDTTASTVVVISPLSTTTVNGTAVFTFTNSIPGGTVQCSIGAGDYELCATGDAFSTLSGFAGLGEGAFDLNVRDTDAAGNVGSDSEAGIVKDTLNPTVTITSSPTINNANKTAYTASGACSENTRTVSVSIGGVLATPTCTLLAWSTGAIDVSAALDSLTLSITADHTDAAVNNATQATASVLKDTTAPTAPTGVAVTPVTGTVVANTLNGTNTYMTAVATITAGEATDGSAVLQVGGVTKATDATILVGDTSVSFTTSDGSPTAGELQALFAAGGVITVIVTDSAGNSTTSAVGNPTLVVDYVAPTFATANVQDTGSLDGIIDTLALTFSETMADTAPGANGFNVANTANHGTCSAESINPTASTSGTLTVTCTSVYTAVGDMSVTLTENAGLTDTAGNPVATVTLTGAVGAGPAITDNAAPVLMTTSPASDATSVDRQADIVLTFSEPMETDAFTEGAEFEVANFNDTVTGAWTALNTVMTLTHADSSYGCSDIITTTLTASAINEAATGALALSLLGPQDGVFSFTTRSCSSGGGGGGGGGGGSSGASTYSITLDEPVGGEALDAGDELSIQWTTGGTGSINHVGISYTTNGSTFTTITSNTSNDGVYIWTIPSGINSDSVMIKVTATDLSDSLDSDTSDEFTIGTPSTSESVAPEAEGSGEFGYSPYTGLLEEISIISPGDYFRGTSFSTVYYLNSDSKRRPFMNAQIYFTWNSTFDAVITVTDATLPAYSLGAPMLPQPGVVLVKIISNFEVFALEVDPDDSSKALLRLIPDETTAVAVYGSDWADYVIDVDVTLFVRFTEGSPINEDYNVDTSIMKKRTDLN